MLKLNTIGRIKSGYKPGWYIYVKPLRPGKDDGSYLILYSSVNNFDNEGNTLEVPGAEGYDNWAPDIQHAVNLLEDLEMQIEWLD